MKLVSTTAIKRQFKPLIESANVQAAMMVLQPGKSSSDEVTDEHPQSEQWLLVISGAGRAIVANQTLRLHRGSLLLIERKEPHRIHNSGKVPLVTINFYSPPAYTPKGNVKRRAKS